MANLVTSRTDTLLMQRLPVALPQEVLLILEECWNNSPELQNVPIYQASGLARRAISVYQTYIEMMTSKQRFRCVRHTNQGNQADEAMPALNSTPASFVPLFCIKH